MNLSNLSFLDNLNLWIFAKIAVLIVLALYVFFAAILNRQVTLMNQILEAKFSPLLKLLAFIHLLWIVFLFIVALLFL